jgi:hypothetical protein
MVNPIEDYEQDKIKSTIKQTVIISENETGETDELDPNFHEPEDPDALNAVPDPQPDADQLDGEGIDESGAGLKSSVDEQTAERPHDAGLNRSEKDDLSLNNAEDELF